jgi:general transcription factor 3C polypeptide 3 (transcription factor C subunit 4)
VIDMEASFFAERVTVQPLTKSKRKEIKREQRHIAETQRQADFEAAYTKLGYLDDGMQNGDAEAVREWLEVASYLIDGFRETPELFPRDGVSVQYWS